MITDKFVVGEGEEMGNENDGAEKIGTTTTRRRINDGEARVTTLGRTKDDNHN